MKKEKETKDDIFVGIDEEGNETIFYKLLEFDSKETNKHYLAYTDNKTDEEGNIKAYGAVVTYDEDNMNLEPIETEKEWKVIEMALKVLQEEVGGNKNDKK